MPRKKPEDLALVVSSLYTLAEASQWIEAHKDEFELTTVPNPDTLKKACLQGRLKAALKGKFYLTREPELREYLAKFDPKNKSQNRPLQPRAIKKRAEANPFTTESEPVAQT